MKNKVAKKPLSKQEQIERLIQIKLEKLGCNECIYFTTYCEECQNEWAPNNTIAGEFTQSIMNLLTGGENEK